MKQFMLSTPLRIAGALSLGVAVLVLAENAQSQTNAPKGSWTSAAPMPAIRNEVAAAAAGGKLYVLGGSVGGGRYDLTRNEEFDPATDQWRTRADLPHGANHMNAVAVNGKIYAIGGFLGSQHKSAVDGVFEYDPQKDAWRTLAPLSSPRGSVGLAVLDE